MPELSTLVRDIYQLFDEDTHHEPSAENLDKLARGVVDVVRRRLAQREEGEVLRFSNLGRPDRQLYYMANRPREKMRAETLFSFLYGDVVEQLALFLARESGHEVSAEQEEVSVDGITGHLDCIIDGVTVDVKSASPMSFKKFETGELFNDDPFGYVQQVSGYAKLATPETGGAFLAVNKVNGGLSLLSVSSDVVTSYDIDSRVSHLKKVISSEEIPERCYPDKPEGESGNRKLGLNCSYCVFRNECWSDSNNGKGLRTFLYSKGPIFLTQTVKEPKVPEAF